MSNTDFTSRAQELRARNEALAASQPKLRARNLAQALGVSEAEWVAAQCGGLKATALHGTPQEIFRELGTLARSWRLPATTGVCTSAMACMRISRPKVR